MPATVKTDRNDPYRNFMFRIKFGNDYVAGLSKCSALKKTTEVVEWWEGGDRSSLHKLPGKTKYEPITLEQGITHDTTFENWANQVNNYETGKINLKDFRRTITIEVYDLNGETVLTYNVHDCWVSEYQAIPDLDASANAVMIKTIKLENEGWEREAR